MSKQKTLIFFGAHPDDETFGIGATLALYAAAGVKVYCVCSTHGEAGTVDPEYMEGYATIRDRRMAEMKCAAQALGLADVLYLGYRDSGMPGSPDNKYPEALAMAPVSEAAGRMVRIIRELKPDVIITHEPGGGYGHPDHIATHHAAVKAFFAANDPAQYPEAGPVFQPVKLYFGVRPHGFMKVMIRLMPLFGQNPHRFGRNKDIDLTKVMDMDYPVHARVYVTKEALKARAKASACHASQGGNQPHHGPFLFRIAELFRRRQDCFMRAYPPPTRYREKDLFEGLS